MSDAVAAPASRNSPCPCGSGRRYKDCHGALATPGETPASRSTYRAPEREWAHLDLAARERLGATMERALALQRAGQFRDAAHAYAEVVAAAPDTHDALHMLGVVELGFGNVDEAERLIAAAMALRPAYAAIEHNWQLVQDALLARTRAQPEQLAERALPVLVDLALARDAVGRPVRAVGAWVPVFEHAAVHLVGRLRAGDHDDVRLLRRLAHILGPDVAMLWAVDGDGSESVGAHRVRRVDAGTGLLPRGGTHVFAGVDFDCAAWIERADADRVIVFCQSAAPTRYLDQLRAIARDGARPLELAFVSPTMAERFGPGHAVLPPLVDLGEFLSGVPARAPAAGALADATAAPWPVGIVGQDAHGPSDPEDGGFVRRLAGVAGRLHIYDPGRFRHLMGGNPDVRFLERRPQGLPPFLGALRCFVHRTRAWWQDASGRELYGAMALGVPVLCPRESIHAARIADGVDGFVYASGDEAARQLAELRASPSLAAAFGRAARAKALELLDADGQARRCRELILGAAPAFAAPAHTMTTKVA